MNSELSPGLVLSGFKTIFPPCGFTSFPPFSLSLTLTSPSEFSGTVAILPSGSCFTTTPPSAVPGFTRMPPLGFLTISSSSPSFSISNSPSGLSGCNSNSPSELEVSSSMPKLFLNMNEFILRDYLLHFPPPIFHYFLVSKVHFPQEQYQVSK